MGLSTLGLLVHHANRNCLLHGAEGNNTHDLKEEILKIRLNMKPIITKDSAEALGRECITSQFFNQLSNLTTHSSVLFTWHKPIYKLLLKIKNSG